MGTLRLAQPQLALPLEHPSAELPVLDQRSRGTRFLSLPVRRVLNPPASTHMQFWSLNPYIGCEFGCSYCYARQTHAWTMERANHSDGQLSPHQSFERNILVKHTAPEVLLRTLDPQRLGSTALVIGTATDPYQPAERKFRLTRRLLETLLHHQGMRLGIITKSPLIARDADLLKALSQRHELAVHLSIASTDPELLRRLEARTPHPQARFRALARLTSAGINAGVLIAPIIPGISDSYPALAAVMEAAREAGARWVAGEALRLGHAARTGFLPLLRREFPELVARYEQRYGRSQRAGADYEKALTRRLVTLQQAFGFPVHEGMRRKAEVSEAAGG